MANSPVSNLNGFLYAMIELSKYLTKNYYNYYINLQNYEILVNTYCNEERVGTYFFFFLFNFFERSLKGMN